ncbi:MAG TPA: thioesterase family protein [Burkholderiaceae bacterium]|nr:thioesterase family protein [Burkholderiaceae bacterium]
MSSTMRKPEIGGAFDCVMPVRWGDLDALNHVNNTIYFRYLEEARIQLFSQAGMVIGENRLFLLAHASCDFLQPLLYPSTIVVRQILTRVGRTSLHFDTMIACRDNPEVVYAKGKNVVVGADPGTGRPVPWTASELADFASCFV